MFRQSLVFAAALLAISPVPAQIKTTRSPMGDALNKALAKSSLTGPDARPFHVRMIVSEPENPQSPYQGTVEEWWLAPDTWRREVTDKDGMHQIIVMAHGTKSEKDEGDYFPLWLRSFVNALFDPVPNAQAWSASDASIEQITMPNGAKSSACARAQFKIGSGANAADVFSNVCFTAEGRLDYVVSPRYSMEFHDYRGFGKKQIARRLVDHPESGTELVGEVVQLESDPKTADDLLTPLPANDVRFQSAVVGSEQMQRLSADNPSIVWPTVHSGNTSGRLAVYISADTQGNVREAWPLNSDNAGLEDPVREQVRKWRLKPAVDAQGRRVQVDGRLGFAFETTIADPLPHLTDAEVRALASNTIEPRWPAGSVHRGDVVTVEISVNEQGKLTGAGFPGGATAAQLAANGALAQWKFRPLIKDGHPQYFHGTVIFTVP
jgi:hypothetical protein